MIMPLLKDHEGPEKVTVIFLPLNMFIHESGYFPGVEYTLPGYPRRTQEVAHHGLQLLFQPVFNGNTESLLVTILNLGR